MADTRCEIGRTYLIPDPAAGDPPAAPDLAAALVRAGGARAEAGDVTETAAVHHDTAGLRLAACDVTLWRGEGGHDEGWHLRLPAVLGVRGELSAPPSPAPPGDLVRLLRSRTRGAALVPVARLRTSRETTSLLRRDGRPLLRLTVDAVRAERLDAPGGGPPAVTAWTEVRARLAQGAEPALLDRVDERLREVGLTPSASPSPLARALARTDARDARDARAEGRGRGPHGAPPEPVTAGDHLLACIGRQTDAIVALDPAVRRGLPDAVHQLRVAARRLRSVLRSYRRLLDRRRTDPVIAELRWLGAQLAADRDNEVLTGRLRARVAELPRTLVLGPVEARLRLWSVRREARSRDLALTALDSDRYLALLTTLAALAADPPLRERADREAAKALPEPVLNEYAGLARRVGQALALPPGEERDIALHSARKAAKRVRYAAEAAEPALGPPAERFARRMKNVQQLLGDHQDGVVARGAARDLAVAAHAAGESAFTWGLVHAAEHEGALRCERDLPRVWAKASERRLRAALTA
ncbi:CYTH and CHAD domain-containing protein [Streptomyces sp. NRRL F-5126]|uniref:CYTH and CHAD domain-containing protein n=1 Tax=Streptomyces sp. NRRL F-5126 TaxID=1463857 RepID=UPI0004C82590|nr:CYTH and CHAD domain-containing protein [Streptomyces sp. NRRL F-5126]